ncbi:MAG TPA: hypothetical protein DEQ20_11810 [Desulfobulbaceae bacterium]|nr:MAG: hypothetical protein A2520_00435 [Deltaproteobacteria bacterium RIFOXYD12_FULL_53_23]HCC55582.1 hypothetical protein [Desulfobulbaceae bacterium]
MTWLTSRLWARLNLVPRLSLVVTLSILLVVTGTVYQSTQYIIRRTQDNLIVEYNQQMEALESLVVLVSFLDGKSSHNFDVERLIEVLSNFKYSADVTQVSFRDTTDVAAFSQERIIKLETPLFFARWCGLETIYVNRPIIVEGVYYGLLSLSMSPSRIINRGWDRYLYLVQAMCFSLALVLLSIWFVLRKALHPLLSLAEVSKTLTQGDLSVRVKIAGSPELQRVLLNFNQMAASFQATLAALQESETIKHIILESLPLKIFLKDRNSVYLSVNKAYADDHALKVEEFVGKDDFVFYPAELARKYRADDREVMESGKLKNIEEAYTVLGQDRMVRTIKVPIRNEAGEVTALLGSFEDITERKKAEQQLEQKNAELERFTYTISHDLKSPIITIKGFLGSLVADAKAGNIARMEGDIKRIAGATDKMQALMEDVLELSRIGRMVQPSIKFSMTAAAQDAIEVLYGIIRAKGVKVTIEPDMPVVFADLHRIREVMQNLIENAVKYMGNQTEPQVAVGCRFLADGRQAYFVKDNGLGIDMKFSDKIFGLFEKLDPHSEGTGIGLALVKRIIELHHGTIWVESAGADQGSIFYFTLPQQPA